MTAGYDVLLIAHIVAGVVGFGAIGASGYSARAGARSPDPAHDLSLRRYFKPGVNWPGRAIFLVPVLGLGLLFGAEPHSAHDAWPWIGLGLWLVAVGLATGACWPAERKAQLALSSLAEGKAASLRDFRDACRRAELAAGLISVVFVAAVAVMIVQP